MLDKQPDHLLRRLYDRLVRGRILSERRFGQPSLLTRLIRMRIGTALVLSAPALALCLWYLAVALIAHVRHQAATGVRVPVTLELVQLHLHDKLFEDVRRLLMPDPLHQETLPTYGLILGNTELSRLAEMVPPSDGKSYYVPAHLTRDRDVYPVNVRYRGSKHWHWNHPQKSWKIRMKGGALLDGRDTFNFINTPEPMPFDEEMILDIAREHGLLTPEYFPFRLLLNRAYLGVYFFETQPDEGLLRRSRRMPGSIYSGNGAPIDPKTGVSTLWQSAKHWKKVAALDPKLAHDFSELEALLQTVNEAAPQEFADFAEHYLDLKKLALFDALDVVFGGNNHDFDQNHKLYFDPYRGRFEPIAWNFRGARHQRIFNRTENPLLIRLKQLPAYVSIRNHTVYELLQGSCSPQAMRSRTATLLQRLEADQLRDRYWDAYDLLPALNAYYSQLLRPMSRERQRAAAERRLREHAERVAYLRDMLAKQDLQASLVVLESATASPEEAPGSTTFAIDLTVGGISGYRLSSVTPSWRSDCRPAAWSLYADTHLTGRLEPELDRKLGPALPPQSPAQLSLDLFPGTRLQARKVHPQRGAVRSKDEPRRYRLIGHAVGCEPEAVLLKGESLVTNQSFALQAVPQMLTAPQAQAVPECPTGAPKAEPGATSPHPWCYHQHWPSVVRLGPGEVTVPKTRVFRRDESVVIAPGTTFRMGRDASLVFRGQVKALGSTAAPIRFEPQDRRWGGVALQGPGTAGSRLAHVTFIRGTRPNFGLVNFAGMINIHDTKDIVLSHAAFSESSKPYDALHVAYVQGLRVQDTLFRDVGADALDLEFTTASLKNLTVVNAGDECVDLMGSRVLLEASRLLRWGGSGVSVGEQSDATLRNCLLAHGKRGLLVKNESTASVLGVLFYRNAVGVRIELHNPWYPGKNHLRGDSLHAVNCVQQVEAAGGKVKTVGSIETELVSGELETLRTAVLGLDSWDQLDAEIEQLLRGDEP